MDLSQSGFKNTKAQTSVSTIHRNVSTYMSSLKPGALLKCFPGGTWSRVSFCRNGFQSLDASHWLKHDIFDRNCFNKPDQGPPDA